MCDIHRVTTRDNVPRPIEGPGVERTVMLTDAVVAIAMTLLILPLVEISGEVEFDNVPKFFEEHGNQVLSFVISFLVIFVFWSAHGTIYRRLNAARVEEVPGLGLLNMCWLLIIAFLPFPTALIGRDLTTTSAPVYIGTMLVLSALTSGQTVLAHRAVGAQPSALAWLTTAVFGLCTVVAFFSPDLALYLLLLLVLVRVVEVRLARRRFTASLARD